MFYTETSQNILSVFSQNPDVISSAVLFSCRFLTITGGYFHHCLVDKKIQTVFSLISKRYNSSLALCIIRRITIPFEG